MGLKYLWDTNTVIYYLQKGFTDEVQERMNNIINNHQPAISVITEIELLCWRSASEKDILLLKSFIGDSVVYELDQRIKIKTIELRKELKTKLPDTIIAASAVVNNHILISRNVSDFVKVPCLEVVNPFNLG